MRKPVDFSTLDEQARQNLRDRGLLDPPDAVLTTPGTLSDDLIEHAKKSEKAIARAAAGAKRALTGKDFEGELDQLHAWYEFRHFGKVRRNHIPTFVGGRDRRGLIRRAMKGGADVDRSGWVRVRYTPVGSCEPYPDESRPEIGHVVPIALEAKVLGERTRAGFYFHDTALQHQLHALRDAANAGESAFLLILARDVETAFGVPILPNFDALVSGAGVQLFYRLGPEVRSCVPSVQRARATNFWDWIPMLHQLAP